MPRAYVAGIFKKFGDLYGNAWTSQVSTPAELESKMRSWAQVLSGVEPAEIKEALNHLPDMPPSAPMFRGRCKQNAPLCAAHRPFQKALPKPPPNIHKGKAALSTIRYALRKGTKADPEYVPPKRIAADEAAFGRSHEYEERKAKGFKP